MTVHGFVHGFARPPIFSCRATYVTTSPDRLWDRAFVPVTIDRTVRRRARDLIMRS